MPRGYLSFPHGEGEYGDTQLSYRDVTSPINQEDYILDSSGGKGKQQPLYMTTLTVQESVLGFFLNLIFLLIAFICDRVDLCSWQQMYEGSKVHKLVAHFFYYVRVYLTFISLLDALKVFPFNNKCFGVT